LWAAVQPSAGDGLGKAVPLFERQYLTDSFYLYHSFAVIVAQPLSFMGLCLKRRNSKWNLLRLYALLIPEKYLAGALQEK